MIFNDDHLTSNNFVEFAFRKIDEIHKFKPIHGAPLHRLQNILARESTKQIFGFAYETNQDYIANLLERNKKLSEWNEKPVTLQQIYENWTSKDGIFDIDNVLKARVLSVQEINLALLNATKHNYPRFRGLTSYSSMSHGGINSGVQLSAYDVGFRYGHPSYTLNTIGQPSYDEPWTSDKESTKPWNFYYAKGPKRLQDIYALSKQIVLHESLYLQKLSFLYKGHFKDFTDTLNLQPGSEDFKELNKKANTLTTNLEAFTQIMLDEKTNSPSAILTTLNMIKARIDDIFVQSFHNFLWKELRKNDLSTLITDGSTTTPSINLKSFVSDMTHKLNKIKGSGDTEEIKSRKVKVESIFRQAFNNANISQDKHQKMSQIFTDAMNAKHSEGIPDALEIAMVLRSYQDEYANAIVTGTYGEQTTEELLNEGVFMDKIVNELIQQDNPIYPTVDTNLDMLSASTSLPMKTIEGSILAAKNTEELRYLVVAAYEMLGAKYDSYVKTQILHKLTGKGSDLIVKSLQVELDPHGSRFPHVENYLRGNHQVEGLTSASFAHWLKHHLNHDSYMANIQSKQVVDNYLDGKDLAVVKGKSYTHTSVGSVFSSPNQKQNPNILSPGLAVRSITSTEFDEVMNTNKIVFPNGITTATNIDKVVDMQAHEYKLLEHTKEVGSAVNFVGIGKFTIPSANSTVTAVPRNTEAQEQQKFAELFSEDPSALNYFIPKHVGKSSKYETQLYPISPTKIPYKYDNLRNVEEAQKKLFKESNLKESNIYDAKEMMELQLLTDYRFRDKFKSNFTDIFGNKKVFTADDFLQLALEVSQFRAEDSLNLQTLRPLTHKLIGYEDAIQELFSDYGGEIDLTKIQTPGTGSSIRRVFENTNISEDQSGMGFIYTSLMGDTSMVKGPAISAPLDIDFIATPFVMDKSISESISEQSSEQSFDQMGQKMETDVLVKASKERGIDYSAESSSKISLDRNFFSSPRRGVGVGTKYTEYSAQKSRSTIGASFSAQKVTKILRKPTLSTSFQMSKSTESAYKAIVVNGILNNPEGRFDVATPELSEYFLGEKESQGEPSSVSLVQIGDKLYNQNDIASYGVFKFTDTIFMASDHPFAQLSFATSLSVDRKAVFDSLVGTDISLSNSAVDKELYDTLNANYSGEDFESLNFTTGNQFERAMKPIEMAVYHLILEHNINQQEMQSVAMEVEGEVRDSDFDFQKFSPLEQQLKFGNMVLEKLTNKYNKGPDAESFYRVGYTVINALRHQFNKSLLFNSATKKAHLTMMDGRQKFLHSLGRFGTSGARASIDEKDTAKSNYGLGGKDDEGKRNIKGIERNFLLEEQNKDGLNALWSQAYNGFIGVNNARDINWPYIDGGKNPKLKHIVYFDPSDGQPRVTRNEINNGIESDDKRSHAPHIPAIDALELQASKDTPLTYAAHGDAKAFTSSTGFYPPVYFQAMFMSDIGVHHMQEEDDSSSDVFLNAILTDRNRAFMQDYITGMKQIKDKTELELRAQEAVTDNIVKRKTQSDLDSIAEKKNVSSSKVIRSPSDLTSLSNFKFSRRQTNKKLNRSKNNVDESALTNRNISNKVREIKHTPRAQELLHDLKRGNYRQKLDSSLLIPSALPKPNLILPGEKYPYVQPTTVALDVSFVVMEGAVLKDRTEEMEQIENFFQVFDDLQAKSMEVLSAGIVNPGKEVGLIEKGIVSVLESSLKRAVSSDHNVRSIKNLVLTINDVVKYSEATEEINKGKGRQFAEMEKALISGGIIFKVDVRELLSQSPHLASFTKILYERAIEQQTYEKFEPNAHPNFNESGLEKSLNRVAENHELMADYGAHTKILGIDFGKIRKGNRDLVKLLDHYKGNSFSELTAVGTGDKEFFMQHPLTSHFPENVFQGILPPTGAKERMQDDVLRAYKIPGTTLSPKLDSTSNPERDYSYSWSSTSSSSYEDMRLSDEEASNLKYLTKLHVFDVRAKRRPSGVIIPESYVTKRDGKKYREPEMQYADSAGYIRTGWTSSAHSFLEDRTSRYELGLDVPKKLSDNSIDLADRAEQYKNNEDNDSYRFTPQGLSFGKFGDLSTLTSGIDSSMLVPSFTTYWHEQFGRDIELLVDDQKRSMTLLEEHLAEYFGHGSLTHAERNYLFEKAKGYRDSRLEGTKGQFQTDNMNLTMKTMVGHVLKTMGTLKHDTIFGVKSTAFREIQNMYPSLYETPRIVRDSNLFTKAHPKSLLVRVSALNDSVKTLSEAPKSLMEQHLRIMLHLSTEVINHGKPNERKHPKLDLDKHLFSPDPKEMLEETGIYLKTIRSSADDAEDTIDRDHVDSHYPNVSLSQVPQFVFRKRLGNKMIGAKGSKRLQGVPATLALQKNLMVQADQVEFNYDSLTSEQQKLLPYMLTTSVANTSSRHRQSIPGKFYADLERQVVNEKKLRGHSEYLVIQNIHEDNHKPKKSRLVEPSKSIREEAADLAAKHNQVLQAVKRVKVTRNALYYDKPKIKRYWRLDGVVLSINELGTINFYSAADLVRDPSFELEPDGEEVRFNHFGYEKSDYKNYSYRSNYQGFNYKNRSPYVFPNPLSYDKEQDELLIDYLSNTHKAIEYAINGHKFSDEVKDQFDKDNESKDNRANPEENYEHHFKWEGGLYEDRAFLTVVTRAHKTTMPGIYSSERPGLPNVQAMSIISAAHIEQEECLSAVPMYVFKSDGRATTFESDTVNRNTAEKIMTFLNPEVQSDFASQLDFTIFAILSQYDRFIAAAGHQYAQESKSPKATQNLILLEGTSPDKLQAKTKTVKLPKDVTSVNMGFENVFGATNARITKQIFEDTGKITASSKRKQIIGNRILIELCKQFGTNLNVTDLIATNVRQSENSRERHSFIEGIVHKSEVSIVESQSRLDEVAKEQAAMLKMLSTIEEVREEEKQKFISTIQTEMIQGFTQVKKLNEKLNKPSIEGDMALMTSGLALQGRISTSKIKPQERVSTKFIVGRKLKAIEKLPSDATIGKLKDITSKRILIEYGDQDGSALPTPDDGFFDNKVSEISPGFFDNKISDFSNNKFSEILPDKQTMPILDDTKVEKSDKVVVGESDNLPSIKEKK